MLYAVNDDNTDQDAGGVETTEIPLETPMATEDNDKLVTQELQSSIIIKHPKVDQFSHVNQLCFSTYIAVSCTKPECVADFKAYLNVIIKSPRHFKDFNSALYDRQLR